MITTHGLDTLAHRLTAAFEAGTETGRPERLALVLRNWCKTGARELPERYFEPRPEGYCRRLLHLDPRRRFSVLVMTWAPGQGTPLHDHDGGWGVECVLAGQMEEESFRHLGGAGGELVRFQSVAREHRTAGSIGILQPPREYHVVRNPSATATAVTVHVYPGELSQCLVFHAVENALYRPELKRLAYTE